MDDEQKQELLRRLYYDPKYGLGSANALYQQVRTKGFTLRYVEDWMKKQETYQIFRNNFIKPDDYAPITGPDDTYQADLMFLTQYKTKNDGYHVILNFIEVTSRKAFSYKLKNKEGNSVIEAFKTFMKEANDVKNLTMDQGSEFINKRFKDLAKEHNIQLYYSDSGDKHKMGKVERFNRTLREKIMRYLKTFKTLQWHDKLYDLAQNYNNTVHSGTG